MGYVCVVVVYCKVLCRCVVYCYMCGMCYNVRCMLRVVVQMWCMLEGVVQVEGTTSSFVMSVTMHLSNADEQRRVFCTLVSAARLCLTSYYLKYALLHWSFYDGIFTTHQERKFIDFSYLVYSIKKTCLLTSLTILI